MPAHRVATTSNGNTASLLPELLRTQFSCEITVEDDGEMEPQAAAGTTEQV